MQDIDDNDGDEDIDAKMILDLLEHKDQLIQDLQDEKTILLEQLESALWDLEIAKTAQSADSATSEDPSGEMQIARRVEGTIESSQFKGLEERGQSRRNEELTLVREHAQELEKRLESMVRVNEQLMNQLRSMNYCETCETETQTLEHAAEKPAQVRCLSQCDSIDAGIQTENGVKITILVDTSVQCSGNSLSIDEEHGETLQTLSAITTQWEIAQADHAARIAAYETQVQALQTQLTETNHRLLTSETECITLVSSLHAATEKLHQVEMQSRSALAQLEEEHAADILEWKTKHEHQNRLLDEKTLDTCHREKLEAIVNERETEVRQTQEDLHAALKQSHVLQLQLDSMVALQRASDELQAQLEQRLALVTQFPPKKTELLAPCIQHASIPWNIEPDHMCSWVVHAQTWQKQVLQGQVELANTRTEVDQMKAAHEAALSAIQVEKMGEIDSIRHSYEEQMTQNREMEHMIAQLREEGSRMRENVRRKQDLIQHYKNTIETNQAAFEEEKLKLKQKLRKESNLIKANQEDNARNQRLQRQVQDLQAEIQQVKAEKDNAIRRCAAMQITIKSLKDKLEKLEVPAKTPENCPDEFDGDKDQLVKQLKRRLSQKQAVVDALKAKERIRDNERIILEEKYERLHSKMKKLEATPQEDVEKISSMTMLDGLRACVYDVAFHVLFVQDNTAPPTEESNQNSPDAIPSMDVITSIGFTSQDVETLLKNRKRHRDGPDSRKRRQLLLNQLEHALEESPDNCRTILLDVMTFR
ncbi:unnamed protein product [Aphanomyces euteiches]|nr:hypothetical protein Ae201684P_003489 [Aphanomyces euteiches]KAH9156690.1 hypothetical protein AeRB84_001425 [Aphanomyces euteiches]